MATFYSNLVNRPSTALRDMNGTVAEWLQALLLLVVIAVLNTAVSIAVRGGAVADEFLEASVSAGVFSLLLAGSVWLVLAVALGRFQSPLRVHAGAVLIMTPLVLGPVPVLGLLAVLATFLLVYPLVRQMADVSGRAGIALTLLVWAIIAVVALAYGRLA